MILVSLLTAVYICIMLFMIPLILFQKGKSSMGLGGIGGGAQMLFGGSGGQDLFQKITWVCGALFMGGSLILSILTTHNYQSSRYLEQYKKAQTQQTPQ